jgi:hypothetical protein
MFKSTTNTTNSNNSYPFVPGQQLLSFDLEGNAFVDDLENEDLKTDTSYQVVAKMQDCIEKKDLDKYKQLYTEEYISNPAICDFFKFEDSPPYWEYCIYPLCSCSNRHEDPTKIHKYMYVRPCYCSGGKRYLAYLAAFNTLNEGIYYDTNPIYSKTLKTTVTPICQFLLDDGLIDLTYEAMYNTRNKFNLNI